MMTKEELQTLKQSVIQSKQSWNSVFYDTFAYTQPERNYVWRMKGGNPGNLKQVDLFTTAGKIGTAVFVARIQNKLSPYEKPYFSLKVKESIQDDVETEMREFGESLSDRANERKNELKLDDILTESYYDLVAGTACIQRHNTAYGLSFHKIPLTDFALGTENNQTIIREFKMPGAMIWTTFPELMGQVRIGSAYISKANRWEEICLCDILFFNENLKQWEYYLTQGDEIVLTRIYKDSPYYIFHWDRASDMPFGTGVGQKALPVLKRLNGYIKCNLQLIPFKFPMFISRNGNVLDRNVQMKPGGFIWTRDPSAVVPVTLSNGNTNFMIDIQKDEMEVKQLFLDYTLPADPREMTAAEVYARTQGSDEIVYSNVARLTNVIKRIGWDIIRDIFERELSGVVNFTFEYLQQVFDLEVNNESSVDTNLVQKIQNYILTVGQVDPQAVWQSISRSKTLVELQKGFNLPVSVRRTETEIDDATAADAQAVAQAQQEQIQAQMAIDDNKEQAIAEREAAKNGVAI